MTKEHRKAEAARDILEEAANLHDVNVHRRIVAIILREGLLL